MGYKLNKKELEIRIDRLEIDAMDQYLRDNNIDAKDYLNIETMGLLDYQFYVDTYYQLYGTCFECNTSPCDEGCPYQVDKGKNE